MKVKTTNRESIEAIFTQSLAIPSFTNTETEQGIEAYLDQRLAQIPYFKEHPDHFGRYQVPQDHLHRSVNWALVDKGKKKLLSCFTTMIQSILKTMDICRRSRSILIK